jgi:hypothetical protein
MISGAAAIANAKTVTSANEQIRSPSIAYSDWCLRFSLAGNDGYSMEGRPGSRFDFGDSEQAA